MVSEKGKKTVRQSTQRTPKNYDGTALTSHTLNNILPRVLANIAEVNKDRPDLILAAWPDIIGPKLSSMTQAVCFIDGFLTVKVKNSTFYSFLNQHEKPRLLAILRQKFPKVEIKTILFKIG